MFDEIKEEEGEENDENERLQSLGNKEELTLSNASSNLSDSVIIGSGSSNGKEATMSPILSPKVIDNSLDSYEKENFAKSHRHPTSKIHKVF